ncbi:hypothetical protein [Crocosphaera chwakensis]|uniref:Uncharacterized protein n=1 Tax=Crocosphaera chwakensis CCY0110 TaxID=391612 RepID=A3IXJ0_9CHRO|nr:hypothetical protein [Crocosphaera chwakensis]EAZ88792.1 hypothetical protein CY0110_01025 [Crocosphaera chwakensis CCY0110]
MPDLILALDFGASATKIAYRSGSTEGSSLFEVVMMPPDLEPIDRDKLERYQTRDTIVVSQVPEIEEIWIETKDKLYAVGHLARLFEPVDKIKDVKYEVAAYKTLAAMGYVLSTLTQQNQLPKKKNYKIALAVVLPWEEFPDKDRFKSFLELLLSNWKYRDTKWGIKLESFSVRQEGFGLFYLYQKSMFKPSLDRMAILMFGHRNISALYFKDKKLHSGSSPLLGFHQVFDRVAQSISWLDRQTIVKTFETIWQNHRQAFFKTTYIEKKPENQPLLQRWRNKLGSYHHYVAIEMKFPNWAALKPIQDLARASDPDLRKREINDIAHAIDLALEEYIESFQKWYNSMFSEPLSTILISGGASWFIRPLLSEWFSEAIGVGFNLGYSNWLQRQSEYKSAKFLDELGLSIYLSNFPDSLSDLHKRRNWFHVNSIYRPYEANPRGIQKEIVKERPLYFTMSKYFQLNNLNAYESFSLSYQRKADVIGLGAYLMDKTLKT